MKIEDIFDSWNRDSVIDQTDLAGESLRTPILHAKYYREYVSERLLLRKLEAELKQLKLAKQEFYIMGPTQETHSLGWKLPPQGKILRSEVSTYVDADQDVIDANLKVAYQSEKVDLLQEIVKTITARGWAIKNAIDFIKFTNGM